MKPKLSQHYQHREPSAIRQAQITFSQRPDKDQIKVINLAIGNVSLPMHPALQKRMVSLQDSESPFNKGVN
ncbi:MAG: pyridoxal phosphate-dependent aminotransferase, partial [Candidatus Neomarinimicrobiota bacterium]|nr:pyridoxal phosphate-dependent aminotransferase [Candidatus Neomarinimicrobiota bacterium]